MPGRGQPWKEGGLKDDTVTSDDIKQGTIKLEDLAQEVIDEIDAGGSGHTIEDEGTPLTQRDTLNFVGAGVTATDSGGKTVVTIPGGGGGGVYSKIGEFDAVGLTSTLAMSLTTPITAGGLAEVLIVSEFGLDVEGQVDLAFTGPNGFSIRTRVVAIDGVPTVTGFNSNQSDLIGTGLPFSAGGITNMMRITLNFDALGTPKGTIDESAFSITGGNESRRGTYIGDTQNATTITDLTLTAKVGSQFTAGSKIRAYALAL